MLLNRVLIIDAIERIQCETLVQLKASYLLLHHRSVRVSLGFLFLLLLPLLPLVKHSYTGQITIYLIYQIDQLDTKLPL